MKKNKLILISSVFLVVGLVSCEKLTDFNSIERFDEDNNSSKSLVVGDFLPADLCGEPMNLPLYFIYENTETSIGSITVANDKDNLNIVYEVTDPYWEIATTWLYVGDFRDIPIYQGAPEVTKFPYQTKHYPMVNSYSYKIPLEELNDCFVILAKARVKFDGQVAYVYAKGINPGWEKEAFYFDFCKQECDCLPGMYRTQSQGGWGAKARGRNPGSYRDKNFRRAFPNGLIVGDPDHYSIKLTSPRAVEILLPTGGRPKALRRSFVNPFKLKNVLVGQTVALTLSVRFDTYDSNFGESTGNLKDLIINNASVFDGMSVGDVLDEANTVLGGGDSRFSPSQLTRILSMINNYFNGSRISQEYKLFECEVN